MNGRKVVLVDDVYTSGRTIIQLAGYLQILYPQVQIHSVITLAFSRNGRGIIPSDEKLKKALDVANVNPEEFKEKTGYGIEISTDTRLNAFLYQKHGKSFNELFPFRRRTISHGDGYLEGCDPIDEGPQTEDPGNDIGP